MKKIFWLDLEMTGLNVETEVIIEAAALITDLDFNELDQYQAVVRQPQEFIERMDQWNRQHHGESGLIEKIPEGKEQSKVEVDLISLAKKHFDLEKDPPVLAGNSISQDRLFINRHMPRFAEVLHYRLLDVSSWKLIMKNKFGIEFKKENKHRALDDIRESISELKQYLTYVKTAPK